MFVPTKYLYLFLLTYKTKDILCREIFDSTCSEFHVFCAVEVQVEPMSQFYLEEHPDEVLSLFIRNIDDESTRRQKMTGVITM